MYSIFLVVKKLISLKHHPQKESYTLNIMENGELHVQNNELNIIVDRTMIQWVREHKSAIYFYIKVSKRKLVKFILLKDANEEIKQYILNCKNNKELKPSLLLSFSYILFVLLSFMINSIYSSSGIDTNDSQVYSFLQQKHPIEALEELYPKEYFNQYQTISQSYYYFSKSYFVIPINPPKVGILSFVYDERIYSEVKDEALQGIDENWSSSYQGTTFFIHPNFKEEEYGFIGLNDDQNRIILLAYEDGYVSYSNLIQTDFDKFILEVYGNYYPKN